jgi:GxxExxY protein
LTLRKIAFAYEVPWPIEYKGVKLDCGYRIDIEVERRIILELKSVAEVTDLHRAQLLTYLRLRGRKIGLILNFNAPVLKDGIVRMAL